jgi:hypothetical protein
MARKCPNKRLPTGLYNHKARKVPARQLHKLSLDKYGRGSYSYSSTQVEVKQPTPLAHPEQAECEPNVADEGMDLDGGHMFSAEGPELDVNEDADPVEAISATPVITKPKERSYENSVSLS